MTPDVYIMRCERDIRNRLGADHSFQINVWPGISTEDSVNNKPVAARVYVNHKYTPLGYVDVRSSGWVPKPGLETISSKLFEELDGIISDLKKITQSWAFFIPDGESIYLEDV